MPPPFPQHPAEKPHPEPSRTPPQLHLQPARVENKRHHPNAGGRRGLDRARGSPGSIPRTPGSSASPGRRRMWVATPHPQHKLPSPGVGVEHPAPGNRPAGQESS